MSLNKLFLSRAILVAVLVFGASVSFASDRFSPTFPPNRYECKTAQGKIVYTTTSLNGTPTFSYDNGTEQKPFSATGNEIQTSKTDLGSIVNVRVSSIPDYSNTELNLILPQVNLSAVTPTVTFSTQLVRTVWKTSIAGRAAVDGVVNTNEFITVDCSASQVIF
jgi:hypothetical protein